jgi:hypothetical protein
LASGLLETDEAQTISFTVLWLLSMELKVNRRAFLDENGESPNIFGG